MSERISCPSCSCIHAATIRTYHVADLAKIWRKKVGFSPFATDSGQMKKLLCMDCGLIFYTPQMIGDNGLYERLSRFEWYYPKNKWEFDFAVQLVKRFRPSSVLEVGCGAGEFLYRLKECTGRVAGVDINEHAIAQARSKGLDVRNEQVSLLAEKFDMIFLFQVLEHLESPREFIEELVRKLQPGGCLVLAVPNPEGYMKDVEVVFLDMPPHHNTCWTKEALDSLAARNGLEQLSYATEPMNLDYLRAQMFAQIEQSRVWRIIQFVQKVTVLALLPLLYALKDISKTPGQTHLVVLKKPPSA